MRAGNQHNPGNRYNIAALAVAACFGAAVTTPAYANPANPVVVNGAAQFTTVGNLLNIVNSPNAIINWGSFSISANEITKFVQQSASSAVLNRVVGQNPSSILGALQSNGRVFLINPNGIVFGAGSQINVGGLVASTLGMSNEDFLAGRMRFTGGLGNSVVNQGNITTQGNGGNVYLIGNAVTNNSIITSPKGEVILAAGTSVELVNPGTPDLRVEVVAPSNQAVNLGSIVANSGRIGIYAGLINQAGTNNANSVVVGENGQITLKATKNIDLAVGSVTTANGPDGGVINVEAGALLSAAGSLEAKGNGGAGGTIALKADVISHTGEVRADGTSGGSVSMQARNLLSAARISADGAGAGGTIDLQASNNVIQTSASRVSADGAEGDGGSVTIQAGGQVFSSTVASATGAGASGKGGTVRVLGNEIVLRGAALNASGDAGGGVVLVGGDLHGQNAAVANAKNASVNFASTLKADANIAGDGGKVVVWSDGKTVFNGQASARGGAQSGNGGFIELSGKENINFGGFATAGAPKGKAGMLQLDPMNIIIDSAGSVVGYGTIDLADPNPGANEGFGGYSVLLPNGNIVATDSNDSFAAPFAGAVYLFNGTTGALISSLTGSSSFDGVGRGVTVLTNGNYVVSSDLWNNGAATLAGAATFGSAATGVSGVVSAANSLVGTSANDFVGGNITALTNGNYLVRSTNWSNGAATQAGAVTFGSGTTGVSGAVSAANSLVGTTSNDFVGNGGITELPNGNYVVSSVNWANGAATEAGAVTFGSGTIGVSGAVSAANSLVGSTTNDRVGEFGVTVLSNGNYVVNSPSWSNGAATQAGAVTWGSGTTGVSGVVSIANSLVGANAFTRVGGGDANGANGVIALNNGNYLVVSSNWNDGFSTNQGAVTFGSGTTGITGAVSAGNSLVGVVPGDGVGSSVTVLPNSNYLVVSPNWDNGVGPSAGAVTFGSGTTGVSGFIFSGNSLFGNFFDQVGLGGITVLANGNYVVRSQNWNTGAGAVTWGSGTTGIIGLVSAGNSLVGTTAGDFVGIDGITALTNGNYVVRSSQWNNGAATLAGAVTWGSGTTGVSGAVSVANSLVGTTSNDGVGGFGVTALANGNYVVKSPDWNNGIATLAGAATFGSGTTGVSGAVSAANSLVGTSANDGVGNSVVALTNGNYVVLSPVWSNGAATSAGAATFGSGTTGVSGAVSAANSLVGTTAGDSVGQVVNELANGNYVVRSPNWNNGAATQAGAVTFGSGTTGISGGVSAANSLVGATAGDFVGDGLTLLPNGNYVVSSPNWDNGAVTQAGAATFGSGTTGISGVVSAANSLVGTTANDRVGDGGITVLPNGNYVVSSLKWNNGAATKAGAVTWGSSSIGVSGAVSAANSLVGATANDFVGVTFPDGALSNIIPLANGNFLVGSERYTNGGLQNAGKLQIYVPGGLSNPLAFSDSAASTVTITPGQITQITNTGTSVVLQANNDITLNAGSDIITVPLAVNGGDITLQAGRSVLLNSSIKSANGNVNIIANETAANGVFDAHRDPGAAEIKMASGTLIDAVSGNISLLLSSGAGLTNNQSGVIEIASLTTTGNVSIINNGSASGGGPIDMVTTPAAITSPSITLQGSAVGTTTGHVHVDPGAAGNVFVTANTGGIFVEQIANTLNTSQYNFSAPAGQEVRLGSSGGNININNNIALFGENLVFQTFGPYDIQFSGSSTTIGTGSLSFQPDVGRSVLLTAGTTTFDVPTTVASGTLNLSGGTLAGAGDVTISSGASLNWTGGVMNGTGRTIVAGAGSVANNVRLDRTLQIDPGGTVDLVDATFIDFNSTPGNILALGTLTKTTGAGTATLNSIGFEGNFSGNSGQVNLTGVNLTGNVNVTGNALTLAGTATANSAITVSGSGTLNLTSGLLTGAGDVTISSGFNWSGGNMDGTGKTILTGAGVVSNAVFLDRTLQINAGGNLDLTDGSNITRNLTPGNIVALGALTKTTGTGAATISNGVGFQGNFIGNTGQVNLSGVNLTGNINVTGNALTLAAGTNTANTALTVSGSGTLNQAAGTLAGTGDVTITSGFNWSGGQMTGSGKTIVAGVAAVANTVLLDRTLQINAGGTLDLADGSNIAGNITPGNISALGTLTKTTGAGTATLSGIGFQGNFSGSSGELDLNGVNLTGNINLTGSALTLVAATNTVNTAVTVSGSGTLNQTSGTLTGTGNLTINSGFNLSGGTISGTGLLNTNGVTTITNNPQLNGKTWNNAGTLTIAAGAANRLLMASGAVFNNQAGGTVLIDSSDGNPFVFNGGGAVQLNNAGLIFKTNSATQTLLDAGAYSQAASGTLDVGGGTLNLAVNGAYSGTLNVGPGATLQFPAGTHTFTGGGFTGPGDVTFSGAAATLSTTTTYTPGGLTTLSGGAATFNQAAVNLPSLTVSGGSLAGVASVAVSGPLNWTGGTIDTTGTLTTAGISTISATDTLNGAWVNNGTANLTGGALTANAFTNTGTLNISGGTQSLNGPTSGAGSVNINGSVTTVGGAYSQANTTVTAGSVTFTGTPTLNNYSQSGGTANLTTGGNATSVNLTGPGTLNVTGGPLGVTNYTQSAGAVTGTGALNISGPMSWTGGTIDITNTLTTAGASTISATDTLNAAWINNGVANLTGGALTVNNLTNAGTLDITGGTQTLNGPTSGTGSVTMNGGIATVGGAYSQNNTTVTAGSVTFTGTPALNNYTQSGGTANLNAGGNASNVNLSGAGTLNLSGGALNAASYIQSAGTVIGTGAINVSGPLNWTGGTIDTTGTLTTAGASTINATDTLNGTWINNGAANLAGGALTVNNFTNTGTLDITGGAHTLSGPSSGTGSLTINGGATSVGGSYSQTVTNVTAGAVTFTGTPTLNNYTQTGGTANLNAGGSAASVNLSGSGTLNLNGGTLITTNYTQSGGVLDGAGTFSASTVYNVTGGTQAGTGATVLAPGFTYVPGTTTLGRSLIVQGTLNEIAGDTLTIAAGRTLTVNGVLNNAGTITGAGDVVTAASSVFNLTGGTLNGTGATTANGVVNITGGANLSRGLVSNNAFNLGSGTLNVSGGTLQLNNGGTASGVMNISTPGTLLFSGGTYNFSSGGFSGTGTTTVAGATVNLPLLNLSGVSNVTAGQLNVAGATSIAPTGVMTVSGGVLNANGPLFVDGTLQSTPPGIINTSASQPITVGGLLDLGGGTLQTSQLNIISSGLLKGKGTVIGNVIVAGTFAPGTSPGIVNINGNYTQTGTLQIELGGITPGTGYDQVVVSGTAILGGTLDVRQFGAFVSPPGATFQVVRAGTVNGTFTNTIVPLIFSGLSTSYRSQFVELGNAAVTTASVLAPVDPSIVKQDRELVAVLKKLVGNDAVEEALNASGDGEKKNTPNCN